METRLQVRAGIQIEGWLCSSGGTFFGLGIVGTIIIKKSIFITAHSAHCTSFKKCQQIYAVE